MFKSHSVNRVSQDGLGENVQRHGLDYLGLISDLLGTVLDYSVNVKIYKQRLFWLLSGAAQAQIESFWIAQKPVLVAVNTTSKKLKSESEGFLVFATY